MLTLNTIISFLLGGNVGELNLSLNNLRSIPPDIRRLTTLIKIDISKNGLKCTSASDFSGLPAELGDIPNLQILNLTECNLAYIPPAVWKCVNLQRLDISRNKISTLYPEIGNLEKLQYLNLQQTNISTLPPEIAFCQDLEEVILWGNVIDSLPETLKEMPRLKTLNMNNRSFCTVVDAYMDNLLKKGQIQSEHIPSVLFEIPSLEVIDLEETKCNSLPETCVGILREFHIAKNYFNKVPSLLFQLKSLQVLDISDNFIITLPDEIGALKNLLQFKMNRNSLTTVPPSIGNLRKLEELEMGGNKLRMLPNATGNLSKLKILLLGNNQIKELPETICNLGELETLDLTDNELTNLPMNLYRLKKIKSAHTYDKLHKNGLWLHKNPLVQPPPEIWKTDDPNKIFHYLKRLQIMKMENLQRKKLLIIGENQCGKTSLIQSMIHAKPTLTEPITDATSLLQQTAWKTQNGVEFLVYDFGGDDIYKITNSLFLDSGALVLLVYDHRKYTVQNHYKSIGYWLDLLSTCAPGIKVKIVGTQCDQCPDFLQQIKEQSESQTKKQLKDGETKIKTEMKRLESELSANQDNADKVKVVSQQIAKLQFLLDNPIKVINDISLVNAAEGRSALMELENELEHIATNKEYFPDCQRYIPANWHKFRVALKTDKSYYVSLKNVQKLAKKHEVGTSDLAQCLQHLNDTGEIFWFKDIPRLSNIIFQRPRQLVEIIKGLFKHDMDSLLNYEDNRIFRSKGNMSLQQFEQCKFHLTNYGQISRGMIFCLWFYLKLDNEQLHELMKLTSKLNLCYVIPDPDIPPHKDEFLPMLVLPWYNKDDHTGMLGQYWPEVIPQGHHQVEALYTFPITFPDGIFEKFAAQMQGIVHTRVDWQHAIFAEAEQQEILCTRKLKIENYDFLLSICVRGEDRTSIKETLNKLCQILLQILNTYPGLVYYTTIHSKTGKS